MNTITIVVKAPDHVAASRCVRNRGLEALTSKPLEYGQHVFTVEDTPGARAITVRWFCETGQRDCVEGHGYPSGSCLWYN